MPFVEREYTFNPSKRLYEIFGWGVEGIDPPTNQSKITYSFDQGYETATFQRTPSSGTTEYSGVFHPEGHCEGSGICIFCGRVL